MRESTIFNLKMCRLVFFVIIILVTASCVKDNFDFEKFSDRTAYRPSFVLPLAQGNLTLGNLLEPDDSLIFFDPDNSIRLMIREDSVFSVTVDDILEIPLPDPLSKSFILDPVELDDFTSVTSISLNELASRMSEPEASYIQGSAGSTVIFPEVPAQYIGDISASAIEDIEYAYFTAGDLELTATNNLPVTVSMEVSLVNEVSGIEVGRFLFENVDPQQPLTRTTSLAGKMVTQNLSARVLSFSTSSSDSEVYIDLADEIEMNIHAVNMLVDRGKVRLGKTLIGSAESLTDLHFDQNVQLEELTMKEGDINYTLDNFTGGVTLEVLLANVNNDAGLFDFEIVPDGSGGETAGVLELANAEFDFSEYTNQINISYSLYAGSENSEMIEFDLTPGVLNLDMWFSNFAVGYASGYFGQNDYVMDVEDFNLDFELFDKISGDFRLTNPSVKLFYENGAGVPVNLDFNMNAESSDGGEQVRLFDEEKRGFSIDYPSEPFTTTSGEILINRESSNIVDLIALPPSLIGVNASVSINPDGQTATPNFITSESSALIGMEFELPLEMQLTDLGLTDTIEIDIEPDEIDMIESLLLTLQVTNAFPLGASVDLSLYDSISGQVLHTFGEMILMEAAAVDSEGLVTGGSEVVSEAVVEITGNVIDHLKQANQVIVSARFNTGENNGQQVPVKFRTTDRLDFRIRLKATLDAGN
ncbi:MAG: hypothetical protein ACLFQA_07625 [Bacteroidales bacterium]